MKDIITIYHGSEKIIRNPQYGLGKPYNDYGRGFYCTPDLDMAKEWAVSIDRDGYANSYALDMSELKLLNLNDATYTIINWLALLVSNRTFDIESDFGMEARKYLLENFLPNIDDYDIVMGYRADDRYFSFAQDFLNNAISVRTLSRAMLLGDLGQQIMLRSRKAFEGIEYLSCEYVEHTGFYAQKASRDYKARADYDNMRHEKWQRGEIYMMQILEQEIKDDDIRLRPVINP